MKEKASQGRRRKRGRIYSEASVDPCVRRTRFELGTAHLAPLKAYLAEHRGE